MRTGNSFAMNEFPVRKLSSSSGLGRGPLKAKTGVRLPVGALPRMLTMVALFLSFSRSAITSLPSV
jgi:hypothetical protein